MKRLNLFHKFLLVLFFSALVGVATLARATSYFLKKNILEEEARDTANLARVLSRSGLSPEQFEYRVKRNLKGSP